MKNLSLGLKIASGFALLIIIAMTLGSMAIWNMDKVEDQTTMLASEYVPEVDVAMELKGAANRVMYEMRGYGFTEDETYYKKGQEKLKDMHAALEKGRSLQAVSPNLKELGTQLQNATQALDTYKTLVQQTVDLNAKLSANRKTLDTSATQYMKSSSAYLAEQNEKLIKEVSSGKEENSKEILERLAKVNMINNIIDFGNEARVGAFKSQAMRSPEIMKQAMEHFSKINEEIEALEKITRLSEDLKRIDEVKAAGASYKQAMGDFLDNWLAREKVAEQRTMAGDAVTDACNVTAQAGMEATHKIAEESMNALSLASTIMMIGLIIALVVGILVAFFMTRSITKPINRIIEGLNEGSDQVASASGQVSSASQSLAEGSSEQAASIEETSSSMEEMSSMTKSNAENAGIANGLMEEAGSVVNTANTSMHDLTQSMAEISKASEDTSKIIKTIDEIAFQTNLLALNAAVEAARAGEAGAGFAVVADEVRNLAMRAAEAARNTSELIEGTVKKVNDGSALVATTNKAFVNVADSTGKVANLVSEISQASQEQSNGISQVNIAITEMDKVVQQNAANAEESASASEEMSAQAEQLKDYVQELIMIVTGNRNQSTGFNHPAARPKQMKTINRTPRTMQRPKGRMLSHSSNEVKPNEVIPFDEDDNFTDF